MIHVVAGACVQANTTSGCQTQDEARSECGRGRCTIQQSSKQQLARTARVGAYWCMWGAVHPPNASKPDMSWLPFQFGYLTYTCTGTHKGTHMRPHMHTHAPTHTCHTHVHSHTTHTHAPTHMHPHTCHTHVRIHNHGKKHQSQQRLPTCTAPRHGRGRTTGSFHPPQRKTGQRRVAPPCITHQFLPAI